MMLLAKTNIEANHGQEDNGSPDKVGDPDAELDGVCHCSFINVETKGNVDKANDIEQSAEPPVHDIPPRHRGSGGRPESVDDDTTSSLKEHQDEENDAENNMNTSLVVTGRIEVVFSNHEIGKNKADGGQKGCADEHEEDMRTEPPNTQLVLEEPSDDDTSRCTDLPCDKHENAMPENHFLFVKAFFLFISSNWGEV